MDEKELKKLRLLLEHWIEHNESHAEEFKEWAVKAKELSGSAVSDKIVDASKYMLNANDALRDAITLVDKGT